MGALVATVASFLTPQVKVPHMHSHVLCKPYQHIMTERVKGRRYIIRNDTFGHKRECISNIDRQPNFTISETGAHADPYEPVAYPDIYAGCSWGVCSPRSGLPKRADRIKKLVTTWFTRQKAYGHWSAGYDIWFDKKKSKSGQSGGAELMIWLNSRGFRPNRWPVIKIGHTRWHLAHWVAHSANKRWNYVQFRRARATTRVRNLNVLALIRVAERRGLIKKTWWVVSVEAGFEIWRGGLGLSTMRFMVRL